MQTSSLPDPIVDELPDYLTEFHKKEKLWQLTWKRLATPILDDDETTRDSARLLRYLTIMSSCFSTNSDRLEESHATKECILDEALNAYGQPERLDNALELLAKKGKIEYKDENDTFYYKLNVPLLA